jgi:hypothetical protein
MNHPLSVGIVHCRVRCDVRPSAPLRPPALPSAPRSSAPTALTHLSSRDSCAPPPSHPSPLPAATSGTPCGGRATCSTSPTRTTASTGGRPARAPASRSSLAPRPLFTSSLLHFFNLFFSCSLFHITHLDFLTVLQTCCLCVGARFSHINLFLGAGPWVGSWWAGLWVVCFGWAPVGAGVRSRARRLLRLRGPRRVRPGAARLHLDD